MSNILEIKDLTVTYGGIHAVNDINLNVEEGKIITLIGANGAGKSTILRTIAGIVPAAHASVKFCGEEIYGLSPDKIVKRGITLVPEGRKVFSNLTVLENLKIGAYLRKDNLQKDIEYVYSLFPRLKERHWQLAGTLSGGEQQRAAIARALINKPAILLADEPTGNLDNANSWEIMKLLEEANRRGTTVVVVTHNMDLVQTMKKRVITIDHGEIISDERWEDYGYED